MVGRYDHSWTPFKCIKSEPLCSHLDNPLSEITSLVGTGAKKMAEKQPIILIRFEQRQPCRCFIGLVALRLNAHQIYFWVHLDEVAPSSHYLLSRCALRR